MQRTSTAEWLGSGKEGKGSLTTASGVLSKTQYSYSSRFENGTGTNPEELIAAAHAGCFSMKLSFVLGGLGVTPERITTTSTVTIESGAITSSALVVKAKVPGIDAKKFAEAADEAKSTCPVSKALACAITLDATLE